MIVTNSGQGGQLPSVEDRGQELNGSSYPSLGIGPHAAGLESSNVTSYGAVSQPLPVDVSYPPPAEKLFLAPPQAGTWAA